jgi:hypothetical protein
MPTLTPLIFPLIADTLLILFSFVSSSTSLVIDEVPNLIKDVEMKLIELLGLLVVVGPNPDVPLCDNNTLQVLFTLLEREELRNFAFDHLLNLVHNQPTSLQAHDAQLRLCTQYLDRVVHSTSWSMREFLLEGLAKLVSGHPEVQDFMRESGAFVKLVHLINVLVEPTHPFRSQQDTLIYHILRILTLLLATHPTNKAYFAHLVGYRQLGELLLDVYDRSLPSTLIPLIFYLITDGQMTLTSTAPTTTSSQQNEVAPPQKTLTTTTITTTPVPSDLTDDAVNVGNSSQGQSTTTTTTSPSLSLSTGSKLFTSSVVVPLIRNSDALCLLTLLAPHFTEVDQLRMWSIFSKLLEDTTVQNVNRASVAASGLMHDLLTLLETRHHLLSASVRQCILHIVGVLAQEGVTVTDLKHIFRLMRVRGERRSLLTPSLVRILTDTATQQSTNTMEPDCYWELNGVSSCIVVTPTAYSQSLPWPASDSGGWTLLLWVRVHNITHLHHSTLSLLSCRNTRNNFTLDVYLKPKSQYSGILCLSLSGPDPDVAPSPMEENLTKTSTSLTSIERDEVVDRNNEEEQEGADDDDDDKNDNQHDVGRGEEGDEKDSVIFNNDSEELHLNVSSSSLSSTPFFTLSIQFDAYCLQFGRWYSIALTARPLSRFSRFRTLRNKNTEFRLVVDNRVRQVVQERAPRSVTSMDHCVLGCRLVNFSKTRRSSRLFPRRSENDDTSQCVLCGQLGNVYLFSPALSDTNIEFVQRLGPRYTGLFHEDTLHFVQHCLTLPRASAAELLATLRSSVALALLPRASVFVSGVDATLSTSTSTSTRLPNLHVCLDTLTFLSRSRKLHALLRDIQLVTRPSLTHTLSTIGGVQVLTFFVSFLLSLLL